MCDWSSSSKQYQAVQLIKKKISLGLQFLKLYLFFNYLDIFFAFSLGGFD
jgi:hypothetical protein